MSEVIQPAAQASTTASALDAAPTSVEDVRTAMSSDALRQAVEDHLRYSLGRPAALLEPKHYYRALALAVRDRMQQRWIETTQTYLELSRKVACYLSAEFLLGPHLGNNLLNLQIEEEARTALAALGQDLDEVLACEEEPGLGNGGLGRLAACYMDSLATLERPAIGYGIRYEFGIFDQEIRDGWQVEKTDRWLRAAIPGRSPRPNEHQVGFGGHTEHSTDDAGQVPRALGPGSARSRASPTTRLSRATASNTGNTPARCGAPGLPSASTLGRLPRRRLLARGGRQGRSPRTITKVLYPNDEPEPASNSGWSSSTSSCPARCRTSCILLEDSPAPVQEFADQFAIQLNDTHPALAVAELMRLLVDEHGLGWDEAWAITAQRFGLHQPHAAARGARDLAAAAVRAAPAAAPGDHLRDQPALPRRGTRAVPGRRGAGAGGCR